MNQCGKRGSLRDLCDFLGAQDIKITLSKAPSVPSPQAVRTLQTGRRKYVPKLRTAPTGIPYSLQIMSSSDSYDRQLDGTGAGIPSLPKIRIVDRSKRSDADVNYTLIGIGIQRDEVD